MKQYLFFATAIATASLFTGCSNNEYVGDQPEALNGTDGAIAFSMGKANTTRGADLTGDGAATKLNSVFYVYGIKHKAEEDGTATNDQVVFQNYKVVYKGETSASNTEGWEYVGNDLWQEGEIGNVTPTAPASQTIKYWDYGTSAAKGYTFYAFSAKSDDVKNGYVKVEKKQADPAEENNSKYNKGYTVKIAPNQSLEQIYFSERLEVKKNGYNEETSTLNSYPEKVELKFSNAASKVRVGFYETVPGYKVKINEMYNASNAASSENKFVAACPNIKDRTNTSAATMTVTYDTSNKPQVSISGVTPQNNLTLGTGILDATNIATTSSSPTWDTPKSGQTTQGDYTIVWPQTDNAQPLKIKVDYKLTSLDGSNEEINVTGATAVVPAEYIKWAANHAYTYIFKISDKTNGSTGTEGTDPAGLYPITFDAVVEDMINEGSTTTVSTPSVTASQAGTTSGYVTTEGIVFKTGAQIDLKVMKDGQPASATITGGYKKGGYDYNKTPEKNLEGTGSTIGTSLSATLQTQSEVGCWVLKVEAGGATTYVIIKVGEAEKGPETPTNP